LGSSLKCVRIPEWFDVKHDLPENCCIEYVPHSKDDNEKGSKERDKGLNISDYLIDLDKEYEFAERIGESGEVELWRKLSSSEEVAVKNYKLQRSKGNTQEIRNNFLREVEALFTLKHPCIVSLKGYCLPRGREGAKLVTEYVGRGTLKSVLCLGSKAPRWWTVGRKVCSIIGIVLGMKYIHSKGFLHRDLKPENIFIDSEYRIRIGDFSLGRLFDSGVTMTAVGTPLYMAPESGSGHYDSKVDVYSFGLIMYEIVTNYTILSGSGDKMHLLVKLQNGWSPNLD
jgi:serine/threonine protein kinase